MSVTETHIKPKCKKSLVAAGATCLPLATMYVVFSVFVIIYMTQLTATPKQSDVVFVVLFVSLFDGAMMFLYAVLLAFFVALIAFFAWSGILLMRQSAEDKTQKALVLSFALGVSVSALSAYPFIINLCRIIAHGIADHYVSFLAFGLIPFTLSACLITINRIAAKKMRDA